MKRLVLVSSFCLLTAASALGQGLVRFQNTLTTLCTYSYWGPPSTNLTFYFGLFVAPPGTFEFSAFNFTGVYATNLASTPGWFWGGSAGGVSVPGWVVGATKSFLVMGWSSTLGHDWPGSGFSLTNLLPGGPYLAGCSAIGTGRAGGTDPNTGENLPILALFGPAPAIDRGFDISQFDPYTPEPSVFALVGAGLAVWSLWRLGRWRTPART